MVFLYIGIAVVVIFLFLVVFYNRKQIFKKREKKTKQQINNVDPDTEVNKENLDYNNFDTPVVKEYKDVDDMLSPTEMDMSYLEDFDEAEYFQDMNDRVSDVFADDEIEDEGPDGSFREMMQQRISIGSHSLTNEKPTIFDNDDDYDDYEGYDLGIENTSLAEKIADLPDDIKALLVADILNKKY